MTHLVVGRAAWRPLRPEHVAWLSPQIISGPGGSIYAWPSEQAGPKSKRRSPVCRWPGLRRGRWSLPTPAPYKSESVDAMAGKPPGRQPCGREA